MFNRKKKAPIEPQNYYDTEVANVQFVITKQDQLTQLESIYKAVQKLQPKWNKQDIMQFAVSANNDDMLNILLTFLENYLDISPKGNEEPNPR